MSSKPKVITSFEEAPQSLRDKCDKEVLQAFFNAHFSITEKSVNDDKRFYLDDGRRIKDDDILVAYMKDRKVWAETGVEIRTITSELTNKFEEKKLKDFFVAGFFLTKKRIKKNKWRYYLPDGRCLDSEKKLDDFLLEKLRPAFDKELCNRVIDIAATAIPGVDKSELSISDAENEKAASLNVKLNGKTYKEAILPYVSYKGVISSSLYDNLYSRCTALHQRNIECFEESHDLQALKQIAESILLSLQVDEKHILLGDFCITSNKIADISVGLQQESALKKAVVTTTVKFDNGRKAIFSIQVAFNINEALLQELYRNAVLTQGTKAISEQRDYSVTPNSILHDFVCTCCNNAHTVGKTYTKEGIVLDGVLEPVYNGVDAASALPVSNLLVLGNDPAKDISYCDIADQITVKVTPDKGIVEECVSLTYSTAEEFLDKAATALLEDFYAANSEAKCHVRYDLTLDVSKKGKESLRCEAKLFDTQTGLIIAQTTRCLAKKLKTDIEQSKEQIPTRFSDVFWATNAEDILMYAASCDSEWIASAYKQIRERLGLLGYYFCKFFAAQDNRSYCKTDLLTDFLREESIDFKKSAIADKMEQFLCTYILLPKDGTLYLFSVDSVRNYYGSFDVYKPVSKYLLSAVAAQYEAKSIEPTFEDMDYLLKDAQYALFTDRCQNAKTEEDAFAIISNLEKQPQTFKKLLFAKEYFKNVYALLNDTDKMFADIVISDCPGCTKLLKSLQDFAEEQLKNV
jgi:hypothetical protein